MRELQGLKTCIIGCVDFQGCIRTCRHDTYIYICMQSCTTDTREHKHFSRPQKTSRLDRNCLFDMAARSGLNAKIYRTPMSTTRVQCGTRASSRFHAKAFVMADTASPYAEPHHQEPLYTFLYVWRCRSLSSTSSLFSGILCSPVRWRIIYWLSTDLCLLMRTHSTCVVADEGEANIGELAEQVLYFISPLTLFQCPNPQSSKALSSI